MAIWVWSGSMFACRQMFLKQDVYISRERMPNTTTNNEREREREGGREGGREGRRERERERVRGRREKEGRLRTLTYISSPQCPHRHAPISGGGHNHLLVLC